MVEKVHNVANVFERLKQVQWHKLFYMVYIEPIVFVLVFAHSLSGTILRNQMIYQACLTVFNYNESDCKQLGTSNLSQRAHDIETQIQPYMANLFMMRTLFESIVPALCGAFIGSWADRYGRKPLLLISMIGFSFTYVIVAIICELSVYYPVNPWYYILAVVPHSVLGGNCVFSVAAFCFISDVTDTKSRPYRMIFLEAFFFIGLTSGSLLSSFIYAATSATVVFAISGTMMCIATAYIALYVPESLNLKRNDEGGQAEGEKSCNIIQMDCNGVCIEKELCKESPTVVAMETAVNSDAETKKSDTTNEKTKKEARAEAEEIKRQAAGLFSYIHIKDMVKVCFKARPNYDRCIIWLVTGTMFLSIFVMDGAMTVGYLFVREKFHWTVRDFTFFETVSHMVPMFGAIVGFVILRKLLSMSVVTLAMLSFFSDIISSLIRGFANESWHLYLSLVFGAFKSISGPMCRTIVSNIVPATDLGKIFSIKNMLQSIAPFLAAPLYTLIYNRSLTTNPGLFNIVSAFLYLIAFIFMAIVLRFKIVCKEQYKSVLK